MPQPEYGDIQIQSPIWFLYNSTIKLIPSRTPVALLRYPQTLISDSKHTNQHYLISGMKLVHTFVPILEYKILRRGINLVQMMMNK